MKKKIACLLVCAMMLTQGCTVRMTERAVTAISAAVLIGAAIAIISNNSHKHRHGHHHHKHCRCRHCH